MAENAELLQFKKIKIRALRQLKKLAPRFLLAGRAVRADSKEFGDDDVATKTWQFSGEAKNGRASRQSPGQYTVALIENRAKEVGIAALDLRSAKLHLSQFIETSRSYQATVTLLQYFDPSDIIISVNNVVPEGMIGVSSLVDHFTSAAKITVARGWFDDTKGALLLQSLAAKEASFPCLDTSYKQYYLCLGAAAALLKWMENEKGLTFTNHSLQVTFNGSSDHMNIDGTSVQNLEVVESLSLSSGKQRNKQGSLFQMLNTTKTVGGMHLLRANLLQPLKDMETINTRLDCLDELTSDEKLFSGLVQAFQKFPKDIDRVLCHFCYREKKITDDPLGAACTRRSQTLVSGIILLKEALENLPHLSEVLQDVKCPLLRNIKVTVCMHPDYDVLLRRIMEVIDKDVTNSRALFVARTQQCFAIKSGIDGCLDVARNIFCVTSEAIHNLGRKYREELDLPNLKLPFNIKRGFNISIPTKDLQQIVLPSTFIQVTKQGKTIHCSTPELISLNSRNMEAATECYKRTLQCLEDLTNRIRQDLSLLTLLSESLSLLDMMVNSFAYMISTKPHGSYNRPQFTENGPIAIEAGRHPILETTLSEDFMPNNTFLSEASNMLIVTGPNMSGKSTYLQQVALITVLAHIGCYVPAHFASFRVVDRILTRIGTGDNLESNSSTFMTEMRETAFLLQNLTSRSLVLIDELGRATSTADGLAIAWSCSEFLVSKRAYTIFASHMQRLDELSIIYPNVRVCYFAVTINNNRLNFKFSLKEGYTEIPQYGLYLAEVAGLPDSVVTEARKVSHLLTEKELTRLKFGHAKYGQLHRDYHVAQKLLCLQFANLSEDNLRSYLKKLKTSYLEGKL